MTLPYWMALVRSLTGLLGVFWAAGLCWQSFVCWTQSKDEAAALWMIACALILLATDSTLRPQRTLKAPSDGDSNG